MKLEMLDNYKGQDLKNFNKIKNDPRLHNIPEVSLRVMYNRGLKTVEDMEKHLLEIYRIYMIHFYYQIVTSFVKLFQMQ